MWKRRSIQVSTYGAPEVLKAAEADWEPSRSGQPVIRIEFAGINPVDGYRRGGTQNYTPPLPFCPGSEAAGYLETPLPGHQNPFGLQPGDPVYVAWSTDGCYADYTSAEPEQIFPLPPGFDTQAGAAIFVNYYTAYRAIFLRGGAGPGQKVLVHGASGGVGLAALQWCAMFGLEVWGTAGSASGLETIAGQNIAGTADHSDSGYRDALMEASGGFDVIVEMRADVNLDADLQMLKPGGRVSVVGSRGPVEITPRHTMKLESDIRGVALAASSYEDNRIIHNQLVKGAASGDLNPVIHRTWPLHETVEAHSYMESAPNRSGKLLLDCRKPDR